MEFDVFPKIPYAGEVPENATEYAVYEKLDGANAGFFLDNGKIYVHSRTKIVGTIDPSGKHEVNNQAFGGLVAAIARISGHAVDQLGRLQSLGHQPHIYGEWLIPHTLIYPREMFNKFYLFPTESAIHSSWPFDYVPFVGLYHPDDINQGLIDSYRESVDRDVEGVVAYSIHPAQPVFKVVDRRFKEDLRIRWRSEKKQMSIEEKIASEYPTNSIRKVFAKVRAYIPGGKVGKRHLGMLIQEGVREFYNEHFFPASKKHHADNISIRKLNKLLADILRDAYVTKLETGHWPMWMDSDE